MGEAIRVFNLTDVSTPILQQYMLENQTIVVGRALIAPGDTAMVENDGMLHVQLAHFIRVGAISVGSPPPQYILAKDRAVVPPTPASFVVLDVESVEEVVEPAPSKKKGK